MNDAPILLVEDSPSDIELTRRVLENVQIENELVVAQDGCEALDYLLGNGRFAGRNIRQQPAIILLDIKLPCVDGFEVLKEIRSNTHTRRQPVIILTSSNEDSDLRKAYDLGVNSYIRKSVDFSEFAHTIECLINYWLSFNEPPPAAKV